ncbi:MAG TPA: polysaccharide biosynthesis tyrosine autokinase [Bryobacteraceae bacterium]|nr:polysaccharide biosynthesis tyrosine autokinase [Bryobacteraceae bacterium]
MRPQDHPDNKVGPKLRLPAPYRPASAGVVPYGSAAATFDVSDDFDSTLYQSWRLLLRSKAKILIAAVLGAVLGLSFDATKVATYEAKTLIEVMPPSEQTGAIRFATLSPAVDSSWVDTQVAILKSRSTADRVTAKLKEPPRTGDTLEMTPLQSWGRKFGFRMQAHPDSFGRALSMARRTLHVDPVGQTRIVAITCSSTDPNVSARFVNALVQDFMDETERARSASSEQAQIWLKQQVRELKTRLEAGDRELQQYARSAGLFTNSGSSLPGLETLRRLEQELAAAQADRVTKHSRLNLLSSLPQQSLSLFAEDTTVRTHEAQFADLQRQMAELRASFTPEHYRVQRLQAQITQLDSVLKDERAGLLIRARRDYEEAARHEELLLGTLKRQGGVVSDHAVRQINMRQLERELDLTRQLHDSMLQKLNELGVTSAIRASTVRVIDRATPSGVPDIPLPVRNLVLGAFAAMALCAGFLVIRDRVDANVRAPGEGPQYLNVPEFGVIPSAKADPDWPALNYAANGLIPLRTADNSVELATLRRSPSMMAESFRRTLASILFARPNGERPRILVVTSPGPGEGKSTVVCNLGTALAEIKHRVLLIDADLRNPQLHRTFDVPNSWGLSDLLREADRVQELPLEALAKPTDIPNLYLLPSGPSAVSISHLLFSEPMAELLRRFSREFDTVLIDTPPALVFADARILGSISDGVILVLRSGRSKRADAIAAVRRLAEDNTAVLGTVLNDWVPERHEKPYSYYRRERG